MIEVIPGVYRSPLPKARDLAAFAAVGGASVVDLTQRQRATVERACARLGLKYSKHPLPHFGGDHEAAVRAVLAAPRPVLFRCFHGRDRTGIVAQRIAMSAATVVLYRVGRNLNRAVRTCEAFGIRRLQLVECDAELSGALYKATGRVSLEPLDALPENLSVLALETWAKQPIESVDWRPVRTIVIGGETSGLPRNIQCPAAKITMAGQVSGLTVEGALAIALHEWRTRCSV